MPVDEPSWWYAAQPTWQAKLLRPAAALYGSLVVRRMAGTETYHSKLPVICIGNFTAGGTGKTPLAIRVAGMVRQLGRQPGFLTRGYGGRIKGHHLVTAEDTATLVGDEPRLLARVAPTMVARDRAEGARAIELGVGGTGVDVIIMDDGLQNPLLAKDLRLVVIDGGRGLGNGRVIPAGPLRAPLAMQLDLADALIVTRSGGVGSGEPAALAGLKASFHGPVLVAGTRAVQPVEWLREDPVVAYCGIGAPRRFFDLVAALGARLVAEAAFADHHAFKEADARRLLALAQQHGARLVTTEKDWVRLVGFDGARGDLRERSRALAIETVLEARDEERLLSLINAALTQRAAGAAAPNRP